MLSLADSASFLWRWQLYDAGPPLDEEWVEVVDHARRHFPSASLAFADLHAGLAEAAIGDVEGLRARIGGLRSLCEQGRLPPGEVAPRLSAGMEALARGQSAQAASMLEGAIPDLARIGGSHAQREVFENSLITAYLRSQQPAKRRCCCVPASAAGHLRATRRGSRNADERTASNRGSCVTEASGMFGNMVA